MIQTKNATVYIGNNFDILPTLPDNSVDSIVTDPPYELGFMGKSWDSSGIAYNVDLWRECLRVLKPGGHLLSFGGTRTWHRIAVAIEDAGFEVRDSIAWMYGSGFPKSLDVSKAIDKGTGENLKRQLQFTAWMRNSGLSAGQARDALFAAGLITEQSNQASHYFAATQGSQPAIATADMFDALRPYLPEVPEEIERLVAERTGIEWKDYKNREVLSSRMFVRSTQSWESKGGMLAEGEKEVKNTAPATPEAQQWEGWGTALKPAFEPVIVARKPLIGTVAANVLEHGTGALNIDGSRIGTTDNLNGGAYASKPNSADHATSYSIPRGIDKEFQQPPGRWPANVILDEYSAGLLDEQSGQTVSKAGGKSGTHPSPMDWGKENSEIPRGGFDDSGGASRFFYVAKASKRDRNEGLEGLPEVRTGAMSATQDGTMLTGSGNERTTSRQNFHPTVKPTTLMRYLVKLVTPPGGTVLDPFTGSGSTGKAAILEGFTFIGCEMTEDYVPIIQSRLEHAEATAAAEKEKDKTLLF